MRNVKEIRNSFVQFSSLVIFGLLFSAIFYVDTFGQQKSLWEGSWRNPTPNYSGNLKIKSVSKTKFKFEIDAQNGANMGNISGFANIKGKKAYFDDREAINKISDPSGCRLTFLLSGRTIEIIQQDCSQYGGNGVGFGGDYQKGNPKVPVQTLVTKEILPNAAIDGKFKALVGKDYKAFIAAFHLIYDDGEDKDNLGAKVFSGCVRGICPYNAAIVMFDKNDNFWAAVIELNEKDGAKINYYSNVSEWNDKMPKTIEDWTENLRKMNDNLEIVYKNKQ